jgi:hypothetical protein
LHSLGLVGCHKDTLQLAGLTHYFDLVHLIKRKADCFRQSKLIFVKLNLLFFIFDNNFQWEFVVCQLNLLDQEHHLLFLFVCLLLLLFLDMNITLVFVSDIFFKISNDWFFRLFRFKMSSIDILSFFSNVRVVATGDL